MRQLKSEKTGTEKAWFMSLVTLAKLKSDIFTANKIVEVGSYTCTLLSFILVE